MNLQCFKPLIPLRVVLVNPLNPASQLIATKILSGLVFGSGQTIHLKLFVWKCKLDTVEVLQIELEKCAFSCTFCIELVTEMPRIMEADVFCIISNFSNPNYINIEDMDHTNAFFDAMSLVIQIAHAITSPEPLEPKENSRNIEKNCVDKSFGEEEKHKKPIIFADGLIALDILKSFSLNIPQDFFFCPTPLSGIGRAVLAEHLKVPTRYINEALVWAVNDENFHVEIEKPILTNCDVQNLECDRDISETRLGLNASWMKKEFIKKIKSCAMQNPYGTIFYASNFTQNLKKVWFSRTCKERTIFSIGVISDGSLGTVKGLPYIMPIKFEGERWRMDKRFQEDVYLKHEIIKINKIAKNQHDNLITYCKNFLEHHVINSEEIAVEEIIPEYNPITESCINTPI